MGQHLAPHLEEQIATTIQGLGFSYVGSEWQGGPMPILRIYVEGAEGGSIILDDVSAITRQLNALFDVEPPWAGRYRLEVSSPGLDRRLFSILDFGRFVGQEVKVRLHRPLEGRRNWVGHISGVSAEGEIVLEVEGNLTLLPSI